MIMSMLQQQSGTFSILYENCVKKKKIEKYKYVYLYVYLLFSKMEISNSEMTTWQISDLLCIQM